MRRPSKPAAPHEPQERQLRADALVNRERILSAAVALGGDRRISMSQIAAAAEVGRSTLYRHFPTHQALSAAVADHQLAAAAEGSSGPRDSVMTLPFRAPGHLGRERPLALEVTHILDEVPPHLIADQLVAEARRAAGVPVALYVVDIDGSRLVRLAGSEEFPAWLKAPPALGPEIVPEGLPSFYGRLRNRLPSCIPAPLWLRGRVIGLLLCIGAPVVALDDIAKQGAAALELANAYTDLIESARRRKPTTAAAEVQYHLLPPRISHITGAQLAGGLLPSYEVGGDWFDLVENRDGAWLAIADASGSGATAAGLSASALGALRAARRCGKDLIEAAQWMDEVVCALGNSAFHATTILARWHAPTGKLSWINCGHPPGYVIDLENRFTELDGPVHPPLGRLGTSSESLAPTHMRLRSGERLLLVTDGIIDRKVKGGGRFGLEGIRRAVEQAEAPTAAATAMAVQHAVTASWTEPLQDDATLVVLAVD